MLCCRRAIPAEEGAAFAQEHGLLFAETSAKSADGVNDAFMGCANAIYSKMLRSAASSGGGPSGGRGSMGGPGGMGIGSG